MKRVSHSKRANTAACYRKVLYFYKVSLIKLFLFQIPSKEEANSLCNEEWKGKHSQCCFVLCVLKGFISRIIPLKIKSTKHEKNVKKSLKSFYPRGFRGQKLIKCSKWKQNGKFIFKTWEGQKVSKSAQFSCYKTKVTNAFSR